jgi:hypothetical protein
MSLINPATHFVAVTPSDTAEFLQSSVLYVGVAGDIALKNRSGVTVIHQNVPVGVFSVQVTQVLATGTTASGIVAWYN